MTDYPYIENNVRSKCCLAPVRLGWKTITKTKQRLKIWICVRCKTRDVDIISRELSKSQDVVVNYDQLDALPDESDL